MTLPAENVFACFFGIFNFQIKHVTYVLLFLNQSMGQSCLSTGRCAATESSCGRWSACGAGMLCCSFCHFRPFTSWFSTIV